MGNPSILTVSVLCQALDGVGIPFETLKEHGSEAAMRAYLIYHKLEWLRDAAVLALLMLLFLEVRPCQLLLSILALFNSVTGSVLSFPDYLPAVWDCDEKDKAKYPLLFSLLDITIVISMSNKTAALLTTRSAGTSGEVA